MSFFPILNSLSLFKIGYDNHSALTILAGTIYLLALLMPPLRLSSSLLSMINYWCFYYYLRFKKRNKEKQSQSDGRPLTHQSVRGTASGFAVRDNRISDAKVRARGNAERVEQNRQRAYPVEVRSNSISTFSSTDNFLLDMRKNEKYQGKRAMFVPFMEYWPTYSAMNVNQLAWYFYWRSEVRRGNYWDTDLSYIFVHIYELINGIGWEIPEHGYQQLIRLWQNYQDRFPRLPEYLQNWVYDFSILNNLEFILPDDCRPKRRQPSPVIDALLTQHEDELPLKLPFNLVGSLCDYSIEGSKFFKEGHQHLMESAIPRIIALADADLQRKTGAGILKTFGPSALERQRRIIYASAVHPNANRMATITIKSYSSSEPLRAHISELVRYAENVLREIFGSSGRLRGVTLDEKTGKLITVFLKKEYVSDVNNNEILTTRSQRISIDRDRLDELRRDSNVVRDKLEVADENSEQNLLFSIEQKVISSFLQKEYDATSKLDAVNIHESQAVSIDVPRTDKLRKGTPVIRDEPVIANQKVNSEKMPTLDQNDRPTFRRRVVSIDHDHLSRLRKDSDAVRDRLIVEDDSPEQKKPLLTDLNEVTAVYVSLTPEARQVITAFFNASWTLPIRDDYSTHVAEINRISEHHLGGCLIAIEGEQWIVEDDYCDELWYLILNPPEAQLVDAENTMFDLSLMQPDMKAFFKAILPAHRKTLYCILTERSPMPAVEDIADKMYTTPDILFDDINRIAQENLSGTLINVGNPDQLIEEEYNHILEQAVIH